MSSPWSEPFGQQAADGTEFCVLLGEMLQGQFGITVDTDPLDTEGLPDKVVRRPGGELDKPYFFLTWNDRKTKTAGYGLAQRTFRRKTYSCYMRGFKLIQGVTPDGDSFDELLEAMTDFLAAHPRVRARCSIIEEAETKSIGVRRSSGDPPIRYHLGEIRFQVVTHDHLLLPNQGA